MHFFTSSIGPFKQKENIFASCPNLDLNNITKETDIIRDLGMDSLDTMEYLFSIDQAFGTIPDEIFQEKNLSIVENLIQYLKTVK